VVAFLHKNSLHRRRNGRMRLKSIILNRFDLAVSGNQAADGTALNRGRVNF